MADNETTVAPIIIDSGNTAFVLVSAALVFLMTPGLAFFYGGLVDQKTVLNTIMMSLSCAALVTIQWAIFGYSLCFDGDNGFIGGGKHMGLSNFGKLPDPSYVGTVPSGAYWFFQLTFAIITPALISGALVGRMRFRSWVCFVLLWATLVYDPIAHWIWSVWVDDAGNVHKGWLKDLGALDFAGGTVVHISSGFSSLVACIIVGPRDEITADMDTSRRGGEENPAPAAKKPVSVAKPHNVPFVVLGASLLWFGWNGFNGGSALQVNDGIAVQATVNTNIAAASAMCMWMALDAIFLKKVSVPGAMCGVVAGLVGITPACGFVHFRSALFIGAGTAFCVYWSLKIKDRLHFDDALDAFGGHGVGGFVGCILTGMFAQNSIGGGGDGLWWGGGRLFGLQILAAVVAAVYSMVVTALICLFLKYTIGVRISSKSELAGLDEASHGGPAYQERLAEGGAWAATKRSLMDPKFANQGAGADPQARQSTSGAPAASTQVATKDSDV